MTGSLVVEHNAQRDRNIATQKVVTAGRDFLAAAIHKDLKFEFNLTGDTHVWSLNPEKHPPVSSSLLNVMNEAANGADISPNTVIDLLKKQALAMRREYTHGWNGDQPVLRFSEIKPTI